MSNATPIILGLSGTPIIDAGNLTIAMATEIVTQGNAMPCVLVRSGNALPVRLTVPQDADVTLWVAAVVANGGSVSAAQRKRVDLYVAALKAGGSWALTDDIWLLVAESSIQALTSLKQRRLATVTNAPVFTAFAGYTFNGTNNFINTGFIPSTHAVAASVNNVRIAAYERTALTANNFAAGVTSSAGRSITLRPNASTLAMSVNLNSGAANFTLAAADSRGYTAGSRNAATAASCSGYKNGAPLVRSLDPAAFGASLPVAALYIGAQDNAGTAQGFRATTIGMVAFGATLTAAQERADYIAQQVYMTSMGAQV